MANRSVVMCRARLVLCLVLVPLLAFGPVPFTTPAHAAEPFQFTQSPLVMANVTLTNWYGNIEFAFDNSIYNETQGLHNGVDFLIPTGNTITSTVNRTGKVIAVNREDLYGAGPGNVVVDYGDYIVLYGHSLPTPPAGRTMKSLGQTVSQGDVIAYTGIGNNLAHLHLEVIRKAYCADGRPGCIRTNPVPFFSSAFRSEVAARKQTPASNFHPWPACNQWLSEGNQPDIIPGRPRFVGCSPGTLSNDNFGAATTIGTLPTYFVANTTNATREIESGEVNSLTCTSAYSSSGVSAAGSKGEGSVRPAADQVRRSTWYRYTPATTRGVRVVTAGSDYDTVVSVYTGSSLGSLSLVDCNDDTAAACGRT